MESSLALKRQDEMYFELSQKIESMKGLVVDHGTFNQFEPTWRTEAM